MTPPLPGSNDPCNQKGLVADRVVHVLHEEVADRGGVVAEGAAMRERGDHPAAGRNRERALRTDKRAVSQDLHSVAEETTFRTRLGAVNTPKLGIRLPRIARVGWNLERH